MKKTILCSCSILITLALTACSDDPDTRAEDEYLSNLVETAKKAEVSVPTKTEDVPISTPTNTKPYKLLDWDDLVPADDLEALYNPPDYLADLPDGYSTEQTLTPIDMPDFAASDRYEQALVSTDVISELNNQSIRLPGFVVPLEFNDDQTVSQFFLVPYFGACIHVPPPPPNQIILINAPQGLEQSTLTDAFWVSGTLKTELTENDMAIAAYSLTLDSYEPYTESFLQE